MNETYFHRCESPIGELLLTSDGQSLTGLYMEQRRYGPPIEDGWREEAEPFREALRQLRAYFGGELEAFDLPLAPSGTDFQLRVWKALREIPFGETWSYGALAKRVGVPGGARAVGAANGRNPISIVVPCHRVIGGSGALTGYGGGLERKRWLLEHEARVHHGTA